MFVCALDARVDEVRMVLMAGRDSGEVLLEGRRVPQTAEGEVLALLEQWDERSLSSRDAGLGLVGCAEDPWHPRLLRAMDMAGYSMKWMTRYEVDALWAAWRRKRPDPHWLRASLMGHWYGAVHECDRGDLCPDGVQPCFSRVSEDPLYGVRVDLSRQPCFLCPAYENWMRGRHMLLDLLVAGAAVP